MTSLKKITDEINLSQAHSFVDDNFKTIDYLIISHYTFEKLKKYKSFYYQEFTHGGKHLYNLCFRNSMHAVKHYVMVI